MPSGNWFAHALWQLVLDPQPLMQSSKLRQAEFPEHAWHCCRHWVVMQSLQAGSEA